ncbi:MAG: hypothetical protein ACI9KE_003213 [Polyangiales bacterium]|jgi:hypothetical protein
MARSLIPLPRGRRRLTDVVLPPERPPVVITTSARRTTKLRIQRIQKRFRAAEAEFYAIGKELNALNTPAVLAEFNVTSFEAFVEAEVMSYSTAKRFCRVAREFPKPLALRLGVQKAYHLARYVEAAGLRSSAATLARADAKLGDAPISKLSALELDNMVRMLRLQTAITQKPRASTKERRRARDVADRIGDLLGVDAKVRVNKGRDQVRVELKLSELMAD